MNELNYATLPASKRLVEAGIVLETDLMWRKVIGNDRKEYFLLSEFEGEIPAPCMGEVWRELPNGADIIKQKDNTVGWSGEKRVFNYNPTDALVDLLIWVRKEAHK